MCIVIDIAVGFFRSIRYFNEKMIYKIILQKKIKIKGYHIVSKFTPDVEASMVVF